MEGFGDKKQFTLLPAASAAGDMLKLAAVFSGKTAASLPQWGTGKSAKVKYHHMTDVSGENTKGKDSNSYTFRVSGGGVADMSNFALFSVTDNHWSDNVTSKAYVRYVLVPYFRQKERASPPPQHPAHHTTTAHHRRRSLRR